MPFSPSLKSLTSSSPPPGKPTASKKGKRRGHGRPEQKPALPDGERSIGIAGASLRLAPAAFTQPIEHVSEQHPVAVAQEECPCKKIRIPNHHEPSPLLTRGFYRDPHGNQPLGRRTIAEEHPATPVIPYRHIIHSSHAIEHGGEPLRLS